MKPGPEGAPTLPQWLQMFFLGVAEAPWTNLKTLNALVWANLTGFGLVIGAIFKLEIDKGTLELWLFFLGTWLGLAMIGSGIKRVTYRPAPPNTPDVEDAQAGATVTGEHEAQAGTKPRDSGVVRGLETLAEKQRAMPFGGESQ